MTTTATAPKSEVIERSSRSGAYDMIQVRAIIQHSQHGRLLLAEGFGGMDSLEGGAYRWKHGCAYKIAGTDTIDSLYECRNDGYCDMDGLLPMELSGRTVEKIAATAGL